ncbi:MAG: insulinase family protein [Myxococcales bacterium]|nr:insulinase family protein [Myxococcales bacterium]
MTVEAQAARSVVVAGPGGAPALAAERFRLACGLEVVVHPDPSLPQVAVHMAYYVGASDDPPGRSGLAHLFEHLFKNSAHLEGRHHYDILRRVGASEANASTGVDRTSYHQVVPAHQLEVALWLESDRMGYFLPAMTRARLEAQQQVVRSERRQRYENAPYGQERFAMAAALYPPGHPLRHLVIGDHADIAAATLDDIVDFYRTWYVPANAHLVIAGAVEVGQARRLVDRYFGSFPASQTPVAGATVGRRRPDPERVLVGRLRRLRDPWPDPPGLARPAAASRRRRRARGARGRLVAARHRRALEAPGVRAATGAALVGVDGEPSARHRAASHGGCAQRRRASARGGRAGHRAGPPARGAVRGRGAGAGGRAPRGRDVVEPAEHLSPRRGPAASPVLVWGAQRLWRGAGAGARRGFPGGGRGDALALHGGLPLGAHRAPRPASGQRYTPGVGGRRILRRPRRPLETWTLLSGSTNTASKSGSCSTIGIARFQPRMNSTLDQASAVKASLAMTVTERLALAGKAVRGSRMWW